MSKAEAVATDHAQEEARAWLVRLRSGSMSRAETESFQRWCDAHPQTAALLRDTWGLLRTAAAELAQDSAANDEWIADARRERTVRTGRRAFIGFAVAAGASWLALRPPLALWPSVTDLAADYRTGTGEQRRVVLSDRMVVEMNTQTRLDVLPVSVAARGIDLLDGEAEIDARAAAAPGDGVVRQVLVVAGRGRMQAVSARFNVRRDGGSVCVTCLSGSLALEHPTRRVTLRADQQVVYDDRAVQPVASVDPGSAVAWRRGVLVFNGVPLADVVDEINRYRPGKIILRNPALGQNRMQAQFPITRLDDVIDMLGRLYGAKITRLPGNLVLLS
ncbi:FecR domain-containing protein [Paraburkholderia sp. D15]|uniref:FecR family protein n=1 Tax=Paraburkholderia sp. D15 TaxID=2880218 RepID=UPI002479B92B|nr:FecR domain-containing protein [Paraburkholderia sp. D15]WGS48378.1 FecR domain-containing protein [Paraburkholderia sp. D15]